jgi:hypothetical protein
LAILREHDLEKIMKYLYPLFVILFLAACAPIGTVQPQEQAEAPSGTLSAVASQSQIFDMVDTPSGQTGGTRDVEIIGGDEETLREFIQRWLTPIYPGAPEGETKVWIGELPDDLPVDIPLPEGSRVVASVQDLSPFKQIILDAPQTPEEITAFYAKALSEAGWQAAPQAASGGGFTGPADMGERYCLREDEAYLEVLSQERPGGASDVRLQLSDPAEFNVCQERGAESMDAGMSLIPPLKAPRGARMTGGGGGSSAGGGSGNESAYSSTDMETNLTAKDLLAHYNAQLEQAGWKLVDQGLSDVVGWSAWKLVDKEGGEWGGTLLVMESRLFPDRRFAMVSVERAPK